MIDMGICSAKLIYVLITFFPGPGRHLVLILGGSSVLSVYDNYTVGDHEKGHGYYIEVVVCLRD